LPFGEPLPADKKVTAPTPFHPKKGIIAGGGTVYSFDPTANAAEMALTLRLEAWGFRNPYGIGFDPFNPELLFVSNNGADVRQTCLGNPNGPSSLPECPTGTTLVVRGSRPIENDWDDLFVVNIGGKQNNGQGNGEVPFFGHPDYFHDPVSGQPRPVTNKGNPDFCPEELPLPNGPPPPFVLQRECPQFAFSDSFRKKLTVEPAFAEITFHGSSNMFDFSSTRAFGFKGDIFIGETGSGEPGTGGTNDLIGFKVARIDRNTGHVSDFIFHPSTANILEPDGLNRPIDVHFRGPEMFIVDFGVAVQPAGPATIPCASGVLACGGGKVWKVTRKCNPMVAIIGMDDDGQPVFADAPCDQNDQGNQNNQGNQNGQ